jgi:hypothetical protein
MKNLKNTTENCKLFTIYTKEKGIIKTDDHTTAFGLTKHREDGPAFISFWGSVALFFKRLF